MRIAFLLPARAGGGGVHSVVQEAAELTDLGVDAQVLVPEKHIASYRIEYPRSLVRQLALRSFRSHEDIAQSLRGVDVAIATVFTSVRQLRDAIQRLGAGERPHVAYYVQDYEPFFCEPHTTLWNEAIESYTLFQDALLFAKSRWLCDQVMHHHRRRVEKVEPSLDHTVFFPSFHQERRTLSVCAMVRPATPRRAPQRTVRMLNWLAAEHGQHATVHAFGCDRSELDALDLHLHPRVVFHGPLRREAVAELLRSSTYFLDLSDYQAFGRTGLEAMACGCIPIMPRLGAAPELVSDAINGFLVDTTDESDCVATLRVATSLTPHELDGLASAALEITAPLSIRRAALTQYRVFRRHLRAVERESREAAGPVATSR